MGSIQPEVFAAGEWFRVRKDVFLEPRLTLADKAVYYAICFHADNANLRCRVRRETLAVAAGVHVDSVRRAIPKLRRLGWIEHTQVKVRGELRASIYQLTAPALPERSAHGAPTSA